ncbi:MAG: ornithine cyclodeaminase family protein [Candidatus Promineofilum sp.]|nr:ornithine cyclodeaminase family protein [Promineifilum sp.]
MTFRIYTADDVQRALPMAEAIEGVKAGYAQLSAGRAQIPLRVPLNVSSDDVTLIMPFLVPDDGGALGLKLVSVFNSNIAQGLPLIHSVVLAVDPATGKPQALIEGGAVTAIRTGAASGAATDVLARPDAAVAAIFGSGVQARRQLEAVCTVRRIERVWVYSLVGAEAFVAEMAGYGPIPTDVRIAKTPREAVAEADVICTATTSRTPVFDGHDLKPGAHVNGIGSYTPLMQENDLTTVRRARVIVDSFEAVLAEAGDLIIPLNAGDITRDHIAAELGEVIAGIKPGRTSPEQITFFKSVGVAVQDAMAAKIILRNGSIMGLGTSIEL